MIPAKQFLNAAINALKVSPYLAARVAVNDPRVIQQLSAHAEMLGMLSGQFDANVLEPFLKTRDGSVYAAAAARGILPLAKPARLKVRVTNPTGSSVSIAQGRQFIDAKGFVYECVTPTLVAGQATEFIELSQVQKRAFQNTVVVSSPFYEIAIPSSQNGLFIVGMTITDSDNDEYEYKRDYGNVSNGEKVYNVEVDEQRRMIIRLGAQDADGRLVYGYQPPAGMVYTVELVECSGQITTQPNTPVSFSSVNSVEESRVQMIATEIMSNGANPLTIEALRILARYPTLSETDSAMYFNDFDYVFRKYLPDVVFLSVWNELVEERVRGASLLNINRIFIAYEIDGMTSTQAEEFFSRILAKVGSALVPRYDRQKIDNVVTINIVGRIASVHDTTTVEGQIKGELLTEYGRGSIKVSNGMYNVFEQTQLIADMLRKNVLALRDEIANFTIEITGANPAPEAYRYVTNASINVSLEPITQGGGGFWNYG